MDCSESCTTIKTDTVPTSTVSTAVDRIQTSTLNNTQVTVSQSDNKTAIIAGVICGLLVLVIVVIVAVLLWRRRQLNINLGKTSQNERTSGGTVDAPRESSSGYIDVTSAGTVTYNRPGNNGDSDDGNYATLDDYNTLQYENNLNGAHEQTDNRANIIGTSTMDTVNQQKTDYYNYI
jgi:hypothetical protein